MASTIEVLLPIAETEDGHKLRLAPRLETLAGKTIGFINNDWISLDITYDEFKRLLQSQWEVRGFVEKRKAKSSPLPPHDIDDLARRADAVITGLGN
ncbi:MAG: hypothetical protein NZ951_01985 [Dehalococcoidia bacterium]|nr:hypothetical protein [Dehalococcoidia bacterium]MDW8119598.1 hypothetical protein [Chloroflexota bacterium]